MGDNKGELTSSERDLSRCICRAPHVLPSFCFSQRYTRVLQNRKFQIGEGDKSIVKPSPPSPGAQGEAGGEKRLGAGQEGGDQYGLPLRFQPEQGDHLKSVESQLTKGRIGNKEKPQSLQH